VTAPTAELIPPATDQIRYQFRPSPAPVQHIRHATGQIFTEKLSAFQPSNISPLPTLSIFTGTMNHQACHELASSHFRALHRTKRQIILTHQQPATAEHVPTVAQRM
jgi:hypothetical protein